MSRPAGKAAKKNKPADTLTHQGNPTATACAELPSSSEKAKEKQKGETPPA